MVESEVHPEEDVFLNSVGSANFAVGISGLQSAFHNIRSIALQPSIVFAGIFQCYFYMSKRFLGVAEFVLFSNIVIFSRHFSKSLHIAPTSYR